jgi:hypothetical protein
MRTNGHDPDRHVDASAGYETRDVSLRTLVKWVVGLYIFIFITVALTVPFFFLIVPRDESRTERTGQNELRPTISLPAAPVIQPTPIQDMSSFEQEQQRRLTSYGRAKDEPGKVHIPIDAAIDRIVAQGTVAREGTRAPAPPSGIYTSGDTTAAWTARPGENPGVKPHGAAGIPVPLPDGPRPTPNLSQPPPGTAFPGRPAPGIGAPVRAFPGSIPDASRPGGEAKEGASSPVTSEP